MAYPQLAGTRDSVKAAALQFFIGDAPIVTDSAPALAAVKQWEVLVLSATGVTPWDGTEAAATAPNKLVVSHMAVPTVGDQVPYYTAGKFNHEVMVWPASVGTYEKRKAAVQGAMIQIGHTIG